MLSINDNYFNALIRDFEKNRQLTEQSKIKTTTAKKKMPLMLRLEFEWIYLFKTNIIAALKNLISIRLVKRKFYRLFCKLSIREKEDIYLGVEKIKNGLSVIEIERQTLFVIGLSVNLNNKFIVEFSNFEQKLKKELYGNFGNRSYTKEELGAIANKYKYFPKDILENHSSDLYSKRYL